MASSQALRQALSKYALPSSNELVYLRSADPTSSYRSSYFRLQVDELLSEIGSKPRAKATASLANLLFQLNTLLQSLQEQQVTQDGLQCPGIIIRHHIPRKPIVLSFQKPHRVDVVGSYILETMAYSSHTNTKYGTLTIDLAIEMPAACFVPKDFRDFRYQDKRNLYLGVVLSELQKSHEMIQTVTLEAWHGQEDKPVGILTVHPSFLRQQGWKTPSKVRIRLLPVITPQVFQLSKLLPLKNNIKHDYKQEVGQVFRTPVYNNCILEDMMVRDHTKALHAVRKEAPHFAHACILAKVWLQQRDFHLAPDSLNGFLISMVLLYLYQTHRITAATTADQMIKVLLHFLALHPLETTPMQLKPLEGGVILTTDGLKTFQTAFDLVFLDASGRLNLFGRVTRSAWHELQQAAAEAIKLLSNCTFATFRTLFLENQPVWTRYDHYVFVPAPMADHPIQEHLDTLEEHHQLLDHGFDRFCHHHLATILSKALTDRVRFIRPIRKAKPEWNLNDKIQDRKSKFALGLHLDLANALRLVDKGPSADDTAACLLFRRFWGPKAELRRFQDGSILEAIVWEGCPRETLVDTIIKYIVPLHWPFIASSSIKSSNQIVPQMLDDQNCSYFESTGTKLWQTFHRVSKVIRALESLPLQVSDLVPIHPAFRATSMVPLSPHPLAYSKGESIDAIPVTHVSTLLEPLTVQLCFERSSAWPKDATALFYAKMGFYVHLAHELATHAHLRCQVAQDCLDVLTSGYVFRFVIATEHETHEKSKHALLYDLQNKSIYPNTAPHAKCIHALQVKHPNYGATVRLFQRWLASHAMSNAIHLEALELIVASVFVSPISPPSSVFTAFLRVLKQLASMHWALGPLIVDFTSSLDDSKRHEIHKRFDASSSHSPTHPALFIAAEYETSEGLSSWTRERPDKSRLDCIVALARVAYTALISWVSTGASSKQWQRAFVLSRTEFDATLKLAMFLTKEKKNLGFETTVYKNMDLTTVPVWLGFEPVRALVDELERTLGHVALFFVNDLEKKEIYIMWKPRAFLPTKFRAINASSQIPLETTPCMSVPNVMEILETIQQLGHGMIEKVSLKP